MERKVSLDRRVCNGEFKDIDAVHKKYMMEPLLRDTSIQGTLALFQNPCMEVTLHIISLSPSVLSRQWSKDR